jgi:hypothetical protein
MAPVDMPPEVVSALRLVEFRNLIEIAKIYLVWSSLQPEIKITSAGEVFVCFARALA